MRIAARRGRSAALAVAVGACAGPGAPLAQEPAAGPATQPATGPATASTAGDEPGAIVIAAEGGAPIPAELRIAVMWANERAAPPIVVTDIPTVASADGTRRAGALPAPPSQMMVSQGGVDLAIGYLVAYVDLDADGTLTPAKAKPWRWPEFRGGINAHVVVHASGPIGEGSPFYRFVGAHPGGLQLLRVALTASCAGDSCQGHDGLSFEPCPERMTLILPADPATYRFPNVD